MTAVRPSTMSISGTSTGRDDAFGEAGESGPGVYGPGAPGVYCPSGFDVMKILFRVATRPNPTIDLGPVDLSCPIVVCDLLLPDVPIVYASESFLALVGYAPHEVLGRNCRFLQQPPALAPAGGLGAAAGPADWHPDWHPDWHAARLLLRRAVAEGREVQAEVINFRKDGTPFVNFLSVVPIVWEDDENNYGSAGRAGSPQRRWYRYAVGFVCDLSAMD